MDNFFNLNFEKFPPESEYGNVEYKRKLNPCKTNKLLSQMLWRCTQGSGWVMYFIGVEDDGRISGLSQEEWLESENVLKDIVNKSESIIYGIIELKPDNKENIAKGYFIHNAKSALPMDYTIC